MGYDELEAAQAKRAEQAAVQDGSRVIQGFWLIKDQECRSATALGCTRCSKYWSSAKVLCERINILATSSMSIEWFCHTFNYIGLRTLFSPNVAHVSTRSCASSTTGYPHHCCVSLLFLHRYMPLSVFNVST
jgi:hypothetical protein